MDFIFMLTRNDRTVEDADCLVDQVCDLGVTHIGFKDVGVPSAAMQELVGRIRRRGGVCYLEVVSTTPESVMRSLEIRGRPRGGPDPRRHRSSGRAAHPWRSLPLFSVSRPPGRSSDPPGRIGGAGRRALRESAGHGVRRRRSSRVSGDAGRTARPGAGGTQRASRWQADRRGQRELPPANSRAFRIRCRRLHDRFGRVRWLVLARQRVVARPDPRHPRGVRQSAQDGGMSAQGRPKARAPPPGAAQRPNWQMRPQAWGSKIESHRDCAGHARSIVARRMAGPGRRPADQGPRSGRGDRAQSFRPRGGPRRISAAGAPHRRGQRCDDARRVGRAGRARARGRSRGRPGRARRDTARRCRHRGYRSARMRARGRAGRGRFGNDQRPLQICRREGWQALRGLRDRAFDERLRVEERGHHRSTATRCRCRPFRPWASSWTSACCRQRPRG